MILANPITTKELRSRMRGLRAILPMMAYLVVLGVLVLMNFAGFESQMEYSQLANKGRDLGFWLLRIQLFLVLILAPAYAASAITVEKERQTFGVMQTTLLTSWDIVTGKVFSGFSYAALLVLSGLPLLSLSFWMGGFDFSHLLWGFLIICTCGLVTTSVGILISTIVKRSYLATGITYGVIIAGIAFSYLLRLLIVDVWLANRAAATTRFGWDTIPIWFGFTLNPFEMLTVLNQGSVAFYRGGQGYYNNPLIDHFEQFLAVFNVPYVGAHLALSVVIAWLFLVLASDFLFRTSREDTP